MATCTNRLVITEAVLESAPHLAAEFAADAPLLRQLARAARSVLVDEDAAATRSHAAVAVVCWLAASRGLEGASSSTATPMEPEAQRRHALAVLLPALQAAAAAGGQEAAGSTQGAPPAADTDHPEALAERPPQLDPQQLAVRRAQAMGTAKRCANLRCPNLGGASEAEAKLKLKSCVGCRVVRYCSIACSKASWREHKVGAPARIWSMQ